MENNIEGIVAQAVETAYDSWSQQHPSLAAVIDRVMVCEKVSESIRNSDEYRQAVEGYQQAAVESNVLSRLASLAESLIPLVL